MGGPCLYGWSAWGGEYMGWRAGRQGVLLVGGMDAAVARMMEESGVQ